MKRGDIIRHVDMTMEEGRSLQRGMNFHLPNKEYGIILMSVRPNAPYADKFEDNGTTIIYEGHDVPKNYAPKGVDPKTIDQPMHNPSGSLTENGKFYQAAQNYKNGSSPKIIKVYEKSSTASGSITDSFDSLTHGLNSQTTEMYSSSNLKWWMTKCKRNPVQNRRFGSWSTTA